MLHLTRKMRFLPYVLLIPAMGLLFIFKLYPIVLTLILSFKGDAGFTLEVYKKLFASSSFAKSLWTTIKMNVVMIPLQIFLAFVLSLLVNVKLKGIGVYRTIFYLPVTISITVSCILWNVMLNPNSGIVNSIFMALGIPQQDFFLNKSQALWCIVILATWKGVGYWMMFLLAGLKNIDPAIYEAARVDGSGFFSTVIRITLPLIKRVLLFVFVANTTSNLLLFVPMQLITKGGPEESTNVLMFQAYQVAFKYYDRPEASAIVTSILILIIAICAFQARLLGDKKEERS